MLVINALIEAAFAAIVRGQRPPLHSDDEISCALSTRQQSAQHEEPGRADSPPGDQKDS